MILAYTTIFYSTTNITAAAYSHPASSRVCLVNLGMTISQKSLPPSTLTHTVHWSAEYVVNVEEQTSGRTNIFPDPKASGMKPQYSSTSQGSSKTGSLNTSSTAASGGSASGSQSGDNGVGSGPQSTSMMKYQEIAVTSSAQGSSEHVLGAAGGFASAAPYESASAAPYESASPAPYASASPASYGSGSPASYG